MNQPRNLFSLLPRTWSLRSKFTYMIVMLFLVSAAAVTALYSWTLRHDMQGVISDQQFSITSLLATEIDLQLSDRLAVLQGIAQSIDPPLFKNPTALQSFLLRQKILESHFNEGAYIVDLNDKVLADTHNDDVSELAFVNNADLQAVLTAKVTHKIGRPLKIGQQDLPLLPFIVALHDHNGRVIGALIGRINLAKPNFLDPLMNSHYGLSGDYVLASPQYHIIIIATDKSRIMESLPTLGQYPLVDRFMAGFEGNELGINRKGVEVLASAKAVPVADWYLKVDLPTAEAFAPIKNLHKRGLVALIVLWVFVSLLVTFLVKRLLQPLVVVGKTLQSFSAQKLLPLPTLSNEDEFTILIKSFNRLLEIVKHREEKLLQAVEQEKINSQARFALEAGGGNLWDWDLRTDIVTHNSQWCQLTGLGESYLTHSLVVFTNLIHQDDQAIVWARLQTSLSGEGAYSSEHRLCLPDGRTLWVLDRGDVVERDSHGQPLRMIGTCLDLTSLHEKALVQRQEDYRREEERLKLVLRGSKDAWWDWDYFRGFFYYSPRWWAMMGYENKVFPSDNLLWKRFMHPDDIDTVAEAFKDNLGFPDSQCLSCSNLEDVCVTSDIGPESFELEFRLQHKEGHYVPILLRGFISRDAQGKVLRVSGTNTDLTERKSAEKALRDSEALFRDITDNSPLAVYRYADNAEKKTALYINKTFIQLFGYNLEDVPTLDDFWPLACPDPAYRQQIIEEWQTRVSQSVTTHTAMVPMEMYVRCKDGSEKYISWGYMAQGEKHWGFGMDLTTYKRAQKLLQNSEEKLRAIFEVSPDGIGMSSMDGIIQFVSPQTIAMWGYSKEEFIGMPIFNVLKSSAYDKVSNTITELLKGNALGALEYEAVRKDGSHFMAEVNCSLIYDANKNPLSVLYIQRDVTNRSLAAKELAEAKQKAEQASQAKTVFVAHMSHEFRTPLNVILGFSQLLEGTSPLDAEQREYLHEITTGGNLLLILINQLLDIAKIESGNIIFSNQPENISTIIAECLAQAASLAKPNNITLSYSCTTPIVLSCDRVKLSQLLMNLIVNAIKYNVSGGRVDVHAEQTESNVLTIKVSDTGKGIEQERLADIFEPFYRLKSMENTEGTGLGLSIVRQLVVLMGGTVGVTSTEGVGSQFSLKLPINNEIPLLPAQLPLATFMLTHDPHIEIHEQYPVLRVDDVEIQLQQYRVLCVDDNASNLKLLTNLLKAHAHLQVTTLQAPSCTVEQALLLCPDVIILDINMPIMDGYQVLSALKANDTLKAIPVIALTASGMLEDHERGRLAGFSHYLTKPIIQQALLNSINDCLQ